jgi:hypothetical protein
MGRESRLSISHLSGPGVRIGAAAEEFIMAEMPKRTSRDRPRSFKQILADLNSPEPSRRGRAIDDCSEFAPHAVVVLAALLRGFNDPDEDVRMKACRGLLHAFPGPERALSRLLTDSEDAGPEVRLAVTRRVLIILANDLAALSGVKLDEAPPTDEQAEPVKEDGMEHAGRWVAWTRDRQRILAVGDSFADVMQQAAASGEPDPYVKKAPGVAPEAARAPVAILQDESQDILEDVSQVFPDPNAWLDAPNNSLGGARPRDLIGTERERELRDLLRGIRDGITT